MTDDSCGCGARLTEKIEIKRGTCVFCLERNARERANNYNLKRKIMHSPNLTNEEKFKLINKL